MIHKCIGSSLTPPWSFGQEENTNGQNQWWQTLYGQRDAPLSSGSFDKIESEPNPAGGSVTDAN